jgi:hypothetical protein
MFNVIKNVYIYIYAPYPTMFVIVTLQQHMCTCGVGNPKPSTQTRAARPNSVHGKKQFNQQKRVIWLAYCEPGDRMGQFAPAPATYQ